MSSEKDIKSSGITRREFFKGSAIALGGTVAITAMPNIMVTDASAQSVDRSGCKPSSWELPAKAIPAAEIKNTVNADVVIIGAGLAGLCAAISAKENGAQPIIIDKNKIPAARGAHITGFDTKLQKQLGITADYRQIIRELVRWAQGRVNEEMLFQFAQKSGACLDWVVDLVEPKGVTVGLWSNYYKGPDYTEYPVTHIFEDKKTGARGNDALVLALEAVAKEKGVKINYQTPAIQLIRKNDGPVTGVITGKPGNYTQYNAKRGVIIATGDFASNNEMKARYSPICNMVDSQIYFPNKCNTGDGHIMAMQAGGSMQKTEPHAAVIHLESGAMSYGFLHVNALGKRFKNEDVNTQSKSCSKLFQPNKGVAWTVYDANGLNQVQEQIETNQAGGLFYGQMTRFIGEKWEMEPEKAMLETHIKEGKVVTANTLEELATKMNIPKDEFLKTVKRYNKLANDKNDVDFGKRPAIMKPIDKPPYYAGKLLATLLTMSGGLHTDTSMRVLDANDKPIENLYVVGAAAGDFFAADYPTICPGIGHGRCITYGRLVGFAVAGKSTDAVKSIVI